MSENDIAIVGMACRLPGARNIDEYWQNLVGGKEAIQQLSDEDLIKAGVSRRDLEDPSYVKACPVLDDIDKFDAAFFGISPRDASVMDPAHRFFLEVAWQALENAGNTGLAGESVVGVFASSGAPLYWMNNVRTHRELVASMGEFLVRHTGNDMNFLATRASYDLDLRGPSLNIQTACSSALVAAHVARQSLLARECDMALIGGSTILVPMGQGYRYEEGEILSPDGHCRPFDHRSAGTVFGSGTACLVLKRMADALDNGDHIYAVIKGSATNNDGAVKVGFLAPGVDGQVDVIKKALASADVTARSIGYVEAHGTGTSVGDPIELTALEQAYREQTSDKQFCGIGSVKSNIGHLGEAAAAASLIKVALALKHRTLPPSLGYERPNPRFAMDESPFFVTAKLTPWQGNTPLRAGITALGAGGTNCHLILEEAPPVLPGEGGRDRHLLLLSAKSKGALESMSANLARFLAANPTADLGDVTYTLAMGRRSLPHRRVLVARNNAEAAALLTTPTPVRVATLAADPDEPSVVFMFPGGGAQYARMCLDLYAGEPAFKGALDECLATLDRDLASTLRALLFASEADAEAATKTLQRPSLSLPTLFAVEYALARLFESYGVRPAAFIGHSMGEYVAACLAGVFSLRDGMALVHLRGKLFETTQRGKMIGVSLNEAATRELMPQGTSIAAVNAPDLCVASGPVEVIDELSATLTLREIDWTPIHIDVAAHSSLLEPILDDFRKFCRTLVFSPPKKPVASNLTGRWLSSVQAVDPEYWVQHLRNTVRFSDCVQTVMAEGGRVFLEIGPGRTLTTLVGAQKTAPRSAFNSVRHPKEPANDNDYALLTLGKIWAAGANVDWTALYDEQIRNRIPLPVYPFDGQSYWVQPQAGHSEVSGDLAKRANLDEWFYAPTWERSALVVADPPITKTWLVFASDTTFQQALSAAITTRTQGPCDIITIRPGASLRRLDNSSFELQPGVKDQYQQLLETLKAENRAPQHIVLLPPSGSSIDGKDPLIPFFFAPVHLAQAAANVVEKAALTFVTYNAFSIAAEPLNPWARLCMGPAQVIAREIPDLSTRLIDLDAAPSGDVSVWAQQLARELMGGDVTSPMMLRPPGRFTQHLRSTHLPATYAQNDWLDDGDVVFITGGLGGIGLAIAEHLAAKKKVKLALLSRDVLPGRALWSALLLDENSTPQLKRRLGGLLTLEALGAQVVTVQGDVGDKGSLAVALAEARARLGRIGVVIHAAGTMDDEPLQTKSDEKMRSVLMAKVQGTINLDTLIFDEPKAFVLMSSVASFLGLPGQVDYTAANAFLDAYAARRQTQKPGRSIAINWNAWRDVGMVVESDKRGALAAMPSGRTNHPWLDAREESPQGQRYFTDFQIDRHWLVAEHQIIGASALIPGTGFVELARAAVMDALSHPLAEAWVGQNMELRNVTFLSPFQIAPGQTKRLQIDVEFGQGVANVQLRTAGTYDTHMTAEVRLFAGDAQAAVLAEVLDRCPRVIATKHGFLDQEFVRFGPRWRNLREVRLGADEALIRLTLNADFSDELTHLVFHPALADMATGAAQALIPGFNRTADFFVPFGYDSIRIFRGLSRHIASHVRLRPETSAEVATFDVCIYDELGGALMQIDGFTMRRVDANAAIVHTNRETTDPAKPNTAMAALLREAITKAEGQLAFDRVCAQTELAQVVVSSVDVNLWRDKLATDAQRLTGDAKEEAGPSFSRPDLASDYVEPETPVEQQLATMWSRLLGVADVGVMDDFFDLGGNSLVAVRFFARVKKDFGVSLPLSTLFSAPTIRALADVLRTYGYPEDNSAHTPDQSLAAVSAVTVQASGPRVAPPILIRPGTGRTPLFLVHDGLGEVLLYRNLALRLAPGHAVYGLEPETSGGQFTHTRIVDMARAKVERLRVVQPKGPYMLAGLCAGGVIAFEMARQLQDVGERTHFVGIIDAADVQAKEKALRNAKERLGRVVKTLKRPVDQTLVRHLTDSTLEIARKTFNLVSYEMSTALEREQNKKRVETLQKHPAEITSATPLIEFLKLYELAHKQHSPEGMFRGGNVVLFRATAGTGDHADVPFREIYVDPLLGWAKRVDGPVIGIDVPGGHSSALQEPHVDRLAREMQAQLSLVDH